jgi:hypothetical protein
MKTREAKLEAALRDAVAEVELLQRLWPRVNKEATELLQQPVGGLFASLATYKDALKGGTHAGPCVVHHR